MSPRGCCARTRGSRSSWRQASGSEDDAGEGQRLRRNFEHQGLRVQGVVLARLLEPQPERCRGVHLPEGQKPARLHTRAQVRLWLEGLVAKRNLAYAPTCTPRSVGRRRAIRNIAALQQPEPVICDKDALPSLTLRGWRVLLRTPQVVPANQSLAKPAASRRTLNERSSVVVACVSVGARRREQPRRALLNPAFAIRTVVASRTDYSAARSRYDALGSSRLHRLPLRCCLKGRAERRADERKEPALTTTRHPGSTDYS